MKALQLSPSLARQMYTGAIPELKTILEETFTKDFFSQKAIDRIKNFEDACAEVSVKPSEVLPYANPDSDHQEALNAVAKMWIIARALNGTWKADFKNHSQYKYYPWFKDSGSGLSYHCYDDWATLTYCGVRFCFKDAETAEYAGKQFIDIYRKFL